MKETGSPKPQFESLYSTPIRAFLWNDLHWKALEDPSSTTPSGTLPPSLEVDAEGESSPDVLTVRDRIDVEGPENVRVVYERLRVWWSRG
jgi:hypothetical protein